MYKLILKIDLETTGLHIYGIDRIPVLSNVHGSEASIRVGPTMPLIQNADDAFVILEKDVFAWRTTFATNGGGIGDDLPLGINFAIPFEVLKTFGDRGVGANRFQGAHLQKFATIIVFECSSLELGSERVS
jgi:hypothetical protein